MLFQAKFSPNQALYNVKRGHSTALASYLCPILTYSRRNLPYLRVNWPLSEATNVVR